MLAKEFRHAKREWDKIVEENLDEPDVVAMWAYDHAREVLNEIARLRKELKLRNKKKRAIYAKLEAERDDLDIVLDQIEELRGKLPADPMESVASGLITAELDRILAPFESEET
jgi:hypothetical protein